MSCLNESKRPPTSDEIVDGDSPDDRCVVRNFLGKTAEQAYEMFRSRGNGFYTEDLTYMSDRALEYYLPAAIRYLVSRESAEDDDFVCGVLTSLSSRYAFHPPTPLLLRLSLGLVGYVKSHLDKFNLREDEFALSCIAATERSLDAADEPSLSEEECLLLMAAAVLKLGPKTKLNTANSYRVVDQVLLWKGLNEIGIKRARNESERRSIMSSRGEDSPEAKLPEQKLYEELLHSLVDLVQRGRELVAAEPPLIGRWALIERRALFEGCGNWGNPETHDPPAFDYATSCRLTPLGESVALKLLEKRPEFKKTGRRRQ